MRFGWPRGEGRTVLHCTRTGELIVNNNENTMAGARAIELRFCYKVSFFKRLRDILQCTKEQCRQLLINGKNNQTTMRNKRGGNFPVESHAVLGFRSRNNNEFEMKPLPHWMDPGICHARLHGAFGTSGSVRGPVNPCKFGRRAPARRTMRAGYAVAGSRPGATGDALQIVAESVPACRRTLADRCSFRR